MLVISYHDGNAVKICKGCCDYRIQHFINTHGCIWTASIFPSSIPGTEADTCLDCLVIVGKSMHVSQAYWKDLSRKISCALQLFLPPSAFPCPCWEDGGRAPPPLSYSWDFSTAWMAILHVQEFSLPCISLRYRRILRQSSTCN